MIIIINPRTHPEINHSEGLPTKNVSPVYPQLIKQVIGILEIFHRTLLKLNAEWLDFLKTLAGHAAIAINGILTYNNLQCSNMDLAMPYDMTLEGWSHAFDKRDQETEGHSERITKMTIQLVRLFDINVAEAEHIQRGALLHEMG